MGLLAWDLGPYVWVVGCFFFPSGFGSDAALIGRVLIWLPWLVIKKKLLVRFRVACWWSEPLRSRNRFTPLT